MKKIMKNISLQWRLTLMAAVVTAMACIVLTIIIGLSANSAMDEISGLWVAGEQIDMADPNTTVDIDVAPGYEERLASSKKSFNVQSIWAMAGIIIAGSLLTYFITGRAFGQLKKFSEGIEQIQAQNLSVPMETEDFPQEIRRIALSFNEMLARLEQSFYAQKQFSANAAHELRTPLAVMRTKLDVFRKSDVHSSEEYEQVLDRLNLQTERLSNIVSELLEMTTLETAERTDEISLGELIEEILCDLEYQAQQKKVCLIQNPGNAEIVGNETLVYRAVFNLIENAIKYNREGGRVTVSVEEADMRAYVTVTDTGVGIPKEYQEQIFEPFFRVDKSRSREMGGVGIGLAMVKMIAGLHGGSAYVKESAPGKSEIVLEFSVR